MSDDSFFREVSEELRQDRVKQIWTRFGSIILAAVVLVILVTVGVVAWDRYTTSRANASGDHYLEALKLSEDGKRDEAVTALQAIAVNGYGAYPDLARMSIGSVRAQQAQPKEAVAAFDEVANDTGVPQPIRDMAAIRAAYILVDSGTVAEVQDRVQRLTGDSEPMRFPAREAIGLAAWRAGDMETARKAFQQLADDGSTPQGIAGRARLMLDIIKSGDTAASASAASAASPPAKSTEGNATTLPAATATEPRPDAKASSPGTADAGGTKVSTDGAEAGAVAMPTTDFGTADDAASDSASAPSAPNAPAKTAPAETPSTGASSGASSGPATETSTPTAPAASSDPADPVSGSAAPNSIPQTAPAGSAN